MEPIFGEPQPGTRYVDRPGAYALIRDETGRMPIMQIEPGRHFLPGGGMEPGETPEHCLIREIAEEIGHAALIGEPLGRATQYVDSLRIGPVAVRAHYFRARLGGALPVHPEHACLWLPPEAAIPLLVREADRWAITRFLLSA
jgi:8-oxo-dGTP diphosphatase